MNEEVGFHSTHSSCFHSIYENFRIPSTFSIAPQSNLSVPGSASNSPRHGSMDRPTNPIIQTAIDRDSLECSFSSDEAVR